MSVSGYFSKSGSLRMPRVLEGKPDELGIRYFGDVLTGKLSVQEAFALAARKAAARPVPERVAGIEDAPFGADGPGHRVDSGPRPSGRFTVVAGYETGIGWSGRRGRRR
jgi:hypothetical protein